ncbi:MAG: glycosyltransferase [Candidatus Margulisiibacteriota bacterium]|jgi:glycosyltransferase involved in cell wall biosynthesis
MFYSIIIPTYNRLPILKKCLKAFENQKITSKEIKGFEIILIDDASTDGTADWFTFNYKNQPNFRLLEQKSNQGRSHTRNFGIRAASGDMIMFVDSDIVVLDDFIEAHYQAFLAAKNRLNTDRLYTVGPEVHTANFETPINNDYKIAPFSDLFITCNASIPKYLLEECGGFDEDFTLYGYEDIEIGIRLNKAKVKGVKAQTAVGFHYHPAFSLDDIPNLIKVEEQKAKMALIFYKKYPTLQVKLLIQYNLFHKLLRSILALNGLINDRTLMPLLKFLIAKNKNVLAKKILKIYLNWYYVQQLYAKK